MRRKPKFKVGQIVIQEDFHRRTFHEIAKIDPDGTLYERCGLYITKISNVRPLTAREKGPSK